MKLLIHICDGCKIEIREGDVHKVNLFYMDSDNKYNRERCKTYHLCDKCFDARLADIIDNR